MHTCLNQTHIGVFLVYLFIKVIKVWCKKSAIIFVIQVLCFLMNRDTTMQRCMKSKRRVRCTWLNKSELGKSWLHIVHIVQKVQLCTLCNYAVHMCPANEWQFAFAASIFTAHTFTQVFFCCADFSALHVCPEILQNCSDFSSFCQKMSKGFAWWELHSHQLAGFNLCCSIIISP